MKQSALKLISVYKYLSMRVRVLRSLPIIYTDCKFQPTCADYTKEAIVRHGIWGGFLRASYRLLRCNPFCSGGYDPVE